MLHLPMPFRAAMPAILAVAALAAPLGLTAVETPLVLRGQEEGEVAIVHPNLGILSLYRAEDQNLQRLGAVNFRADLDFFAKLFVAERGGVVWTALRTGSMNQKVTGAKGDLLGEFAGVPTKAEKEQGLKSLRERAVDCEDKFWAVERPYDGKVRAAFANQYLMLAMPALHALVVYEAVGDGWKQFAWRNYGPELLVPQVWNSEPKPQDLVDELLAKATTPEKHEQFEKALTGIGALPDGPTPNSDCWIGSAANETFVLVDPPTTRIALYQVTGKALELRSVRNFTVDLAIPRLIGENIRSSPGDRDLLAAWARDPARQSWAKRFGITADRAEIAALVGQSSAGAANAIEATIQNDRLVIDLPGERTVLTYDLNGGQSISLISVRNYTLDVGVALFDQQFRDRANGAEAVRRAKDLAAQRAPTTALAMLRLGLKLDPFLVEGVAKDGAFRDVKKLPEWQPMIDEAIKEAQRQAALVEERRKAAAEARKKSGGDDSEGDAGE